MYYGDNRNAVNNYFKTCLKLVSNLSLHAHGDSICCRARFSRL